MCVCPPTFAIENSALLSNVATTYCKMNNKHMCSITLTYILLLRSYSYQYYQHYRDLLIIGYWHIQPTTH